MASLASTPGITSIGQALAAQWPLQILTEIAPPDLPGKLALYWTKLVTGDKGVLTLGYFLPQERIPEV